MLLPGQITAEVQSYSVIEYVKDSWKQNISTNSGVVNSLMVGVPQNEEGIIGMGIELIYQRYRVKNARR